MDIFRHKHSMMLIEIIFFILIVGIIYSVAIAKIPTKLNAGVDKMLLYFKYIRYVAMIDDTYDIDNNEWFRKRWSIKFQKCNKNKGGRYFLVFKNENTINGTNTVKRVETLRDPINNKHLYKTNTCDNYKKDSPYTLLTKQFDIVDILSSCQASKSQTAIQITFAKDGRIFNRIGANEGDDEITQKCEITFIDKNNKRKTIILEPKTGYAHKK